MNDKEKIAQNTKKSKANKYVKKFLDEDVIYMITEKHERVVKIGYTSNFANRMKSYRSHSTSFEIIDVIYGDKDLERYYQEWLEGLGFTKHYDDISEWYDLPDTMPKAKIMGGFKVIEEMIEECIKKLHKLAEKA